MRTSKSPVRRTAAKTKPADFRVFSVRLPHAGIVALLVAGVLWGLFVLAVQPPADSSATRNETAAIRK